MMKKILCLIVVMLLSIHSLVACTISQGGSSSNYELSIESIYQKEGYEALYAYQLFRTSYHETDVNLLDIPLRLLEYSNIILESDWTTKESDSRSKGELNREIVEKIKQFLTEEELKELGGLSIDDKFLVFQDAIYAFTYKEIEKFGDCQCYLVKYVPDTEVLYTSFIVDYHVIHEETTGMLVAYEDGTVCIADALWFDEELQQVDKAAVNYSDYFFSKEEIKDNLKKAGLDELADDAEYIKHEGVVGDRFYCTFSLESQVGTGDDMLACLETYLMEMDTDGNVLSVIHIGGLPYRELSSVIPKILDREDGNYYDVTRLLPY